MNTIKGYFGAKSVYRQMSCQGIPSQALLPSSDYYHKLSKHPLLVLTFPLTRKLIWHGSETNLAWKELSYVNKK